MKIGAVNNPLNPLLDEIRWIGENGFDYLDLALEAPQAVPDHFDLPAVRAALADFGLPVVVRAASDLPVSHAVGRIRTAALAELRRGIDLSAELGAKLLVTHFMHWPDWMPDAAGVELYGQLYDRLCAHGKQAGVLVAISNHPHNAHQLKRLRNIIARVPDLRLAPHVGHANILVPKNQMREYLFDMGERFVHLYLSDNDGTANDRLPLGAPASGGVDWRRQVADFRTFGYARTFTLDLGGEKRWLLVSREYLHEVWSTSA